MTTGALIFAFNNESTDYVRMAAWSAKNIHRHLDIPVSVVTNAREQAELYSSFDNIIDAVPETGGTRYFEDYASSVSWHNAGRVNAYKLTPYDKTLVLDADYVVASDQLRQVIDLPHNFLCHKDAWDLSTGSFLTELNSFGRYQMPMWWATVMMFQRSTIAEYIFDSMTMVRENWQHYRDLYNIDRPTYRNDFALSIALGIVSGHTLEVDTMPWPLASTLPEHTVQQLDQDYYSITYKNTEGQVKTVGIGGQDFHAMGKQQLEAVIANS